MKITLAFLLLGISLALTNAASISKRKMSQSEAFSHGRMMTLVVKRWSDWQNCHKCSDKERYCMEKALVEDICFILKLLTNDIGSTLQQLLGKAKFQFQHAALYKAVETNNFEHLALTLRTHGLMNHFVETVCGVLNPTLKQSSVEIAVILQSTNTKMDGVLNVGLGCLTNTLGINFKDAAGKIIHATSELFGELTNTATGVVNGVVGGATGFIGGLGSKISGVANTVTGLSGSLGGQVGGVTNMATGLVGGLGSKISGVANTVTGLSGGLGGQVGGVTNMATGLVGGLGSKISGLANTVTGLSGGLLKPLR